MTATLPIFGRRMGRLCAVLLAASLASCGGGGGGGSAGGTGSGSAGGAEPTGTATLASGLDHPWGMAFLPDGRYLVTERPGRLRIVGSDGALRSVTGLPPVLAEGQGGLLDIALDPAFSANRRIYWSYAEAGSGAEAGLSGLAVARGTLDVADGSVSSVQVIYRQAPKVSGSAHYGGRIVFADDGKLFVTMGERDNPRSDAQNLARGHGKVVRLNADGTIPADNPSLGASAQPGIWSYGHRNPQAAAIHPTTGELWTAEHGPQGGDELNITRAGRNYGWPLVSFGCEYADPIDSCSWSGGTALAGTEPPRAHWAKVSTAPSGLMIYAGSRWPAWRGKAFTGALAGRTLWRLDIDQGGPIVCIPPAGQSANNCSEVEAVKALGVRIRDVREGPDGHVYLLTDQGGGADRLIRLQ